MQKLYHQRSVSPLECITEHTKTVISFVIALLIPLGYLHFPKIPDCLNMVSQNDWCTHKFW